MRLYSNVPSGLTLDEIILGLEVESRSRSLRDTEWCVDAGQHVCEMSWHTDRIWIAQHPRGFPVSCDTLSPIMIWNLFRIVALGKWLFLFLPTLLLVLSDLSDQNQRQALRLFVMTFLQKKILSALARKNSRQFVARSPGSIRCNQFYWCILCFE